MNQESVKGQYVCRKCSRVLKNEDVTEAEYNAMKDTKSDCTVCEEKDSVEFKIDKRLKPEGWK